MKLIDEWERADVREKFEFLCGLDKRYRGEEHKYGNGLFKLWVCFCKKIESKDDNWRNADW